MADLERRLRRYRRFRRRRRQGVGRVLFDRNNPLEMLSREEIRERYRFHPESIYTLDELVFARLDRPTRRSSPIPPLLSVLVTLQFFASGAHYLLIGDLHGLSKTSICRAVRTTASEIASLLGQFIKLPTRGDLQMTKREFYNIARFPKVFGVIDCTHVKILAPSRNENDFVNRKGYHSINVQAVCDAKFQLINLVAKWPGSVHDSRIFRESELCRQLETGAINGILLGDSGYACRPYLMTPYLNTQNATQERFNDALVKTCVLTEQTFGVLKRRFPCLSYGLRCSPSRAVQTITACCVLHNFGLIRGDIFCRVTDVTLAPPDYQGAGVAQGGPGARIRDVMADTYFRQ